MGDNSRNTFAPADHVSSVRLQQGRVVTDADWNEQADLLRHRDERATEDLVGPCGAPLHTAGFGLRAATQARAVHARSDTEFWITGEDGVVLSTSDGGATFTVREVGTTANLRGIGFAGTTGWIVGDDGTVLRSVDGGASWTALAVGEGATLHAVTAVGAALAWVVGAGGRVLRTADGGASWDTAQAGTLALYAVHFFDANAGIAAGIDGIWRSSDGGASWAAVASSAGQRLRALQFVDATRGVAVGDGGAVLRTADAGQTWTPVATTTTATLYAVGFHSPSDGWIAGSGGTALRTNDGGATWAEVDLGITATMRGVATRPASIGWIVGDDSTAVRLQAGSPAFTPRTLPAAALCIDAGRFYAHGTLCEQEERTSYHHQPDRGRIERLAAGTHLLYLHVWQRELSFLELPRSREVALGGPDTATRLRTLGQVRAIALPPASPPAWHCASQVPEWDALVGHVPPRLRARAEPQAAGTSVCEVAATAGYRRLENQLYRITVHDGGSTPTFTWSRENASVAYGIESLVVDVIGDETTVKLAARGRDDNLDLAVDDWIEIVDDDTALEERVGALFQFVRDGNDALEIVVRGQVPATLAHDPARHPLVRRWDHRPVAPAAALPITPGVWLPLEDGVEVQFEPGSAWRPGDHWLVPARTATGDVEWPLDADQRPAARRPDGIADTYCRLGIVAVGTDGTVQVLADCRPLFPPATELVQLLSVGGDGQDEVPGAELAQTLVVRVARGEHPVANAPVRFSRELGGGALVGEVGGELVVATDAAGFAEARLQLGTDPGLAARRHLVRAELLDGASTPRPGQTVLFHALARTLLQLNGGLGQQAAANQQLPQPIEVRVGNGQQPMAGARVRFTASGGGSVAATLATTNAAGLASTTWRLGASGAQRVQAELLDAADAPVAQVEFDAHFREGGGSGGCAITIGRGGQIERLDSETLRRLLEEHRNRVCLCFLAGEHVIEDLRVENPEALVSIHGCGHAARLQLRRPIEFTGFTAIELADLGIEAEQGAGIVLRDCAEVRVRGIAANSPAQSAVPLLSIGSREAARAATVEVHGCSLRSAGVALVVLDALAITHVTHNEIRGVLSFYGPPVAVTSFPSRELGAALKAAGVNVTLEVTRGQLFLADNSIDLLTVGRTMLAQLTQAAMGQATQVRGLFASAAIAGNSFTAIGHLMASGTATVTGCTFLTDPPAANRPFGTFVASDSSITGAAGTRDDRFVVEMVFKRFAAEAGNVPFIRRL